MTGKRDVMMIGTLAEAADVNVETIRYYQRRGLLREPERPYGGVRRYGPEDLDRLVFVKSGKNLGFSLDDIGNLLKLDDGMHCTDAAKLAKQRLADVRAKLTTLRNMEAALADLVEACRDAPGDVSCPLIDALHDGA